MQSVASMPLTQELFPPEVSDPASAVTQLFVVLNTTNHSLAYWGKLKPALIIY